MNEILISLIQQSNSLVEICKDYATSDKNEYQTKEFIINLNSFTKSLEGNVLYANAYKSLLLEDFRHLANLWHLETDFLSSSTEKVNNENYLRIIGKGKMVIPFILKELRDNGGYWFTALRIITCQNL